MRTLWLLASLGAGCSGPQVPESVVAPVIAASPGTVASPGSEASAPAAPPADPLAPVRHIGDGRCEPMPREHQPCVEGDGYCVISWGEPGGWSSALWCRGGQWEIEEERNLPE